MSASLDLTPMKFMQAYRTARIVIANRTRHFDVPTEPHFDSESTAYFRKRLETSRSYLEYGSGGSTILANKMVNTLVSVDSDANFLGNVRRKLTEDDLGAVGRRAMTKLIHVNIGLTQDWGMPVFTKPTRRRVRRWADYPMAPWRYFRSIAQQPDLVLVDGRFRVACVLESLLSLSPLSKTQILLDDYVDRPYYKIVEQFADVQMAGRMAILHPRRLMDRIQVRRLVKQYCADYR
jgi:hypothetical protein